MTGVSLGGMHTWLTAAADERVAAAAPMIGVQWFGWAVQEKRYQARVESIPLVFQAAAADMAQQAQQGQQQGDGGSDGSGSSGGSASVTPEVVTAVLRRLLPGELRFRPGCRRCWVPLGAFSAEPPLPPSPTRHLRQAC